MLKVYGITYDNTLNYGSELQAYALQTAVESLKIDGGSCSYALIPIGKILLGEALRSREGTIKNKINKYSYQTIVWFKRKTFRDFEKKNMHFAPCKTRGDLPSLNADADAFVCGSDVIWRPIINGGAYEGGAFYLDFTDKYKFAYAASFGLAEPDESVLAFAAPRLKELREIGVREASAVEVVRRCANREAEVLGDPVTLLTASDWSALAGDGEKKGKVFVYTTHDHPAVPSLASKLSAAACAEVETCNWRVKPHGLSIREVLSPIPAPKEWIRLIRDAEYVVTNSFHATVFSLIFHKKFFTVVHGDPQGGVNFRMYDLLKAVGLEDRILSEMPETVDLSEPDFSRTDAYLNALREKSFAFLRRNLEAAAREKKDSGTAGFSVSKTED